ncbi:MAG: amino acid adenylation domain-containing protein [Elusimicrobia bacterium]|nr:amino acid adenylation domain-containing protein [Elusimicrobiota bacterium]
MLTQTLAGWLAEARLKHPRRLALAWRGREYSYARLYAEASALAGELRDLGVEPSDKVAVYLERSARAVVAIHACLMLGACYVPIDPQNPWLRLLGLIEDCRARALVTASRLLPSGEPVPTAVRLILVDRPHGACGAGPKRRADGRAVPASDAAYVLYTSGSTGTPKGVLMTNRNAAAFVGWAHREFRIRPSDRIANLAPFQFDLSVFDLFNSCRAGASLHIIPYPDSLFAPRIARFLAKRRISVFYTVPSVLTAVESLGSMGPGVFPDLRLLLFAGEVLSPRVLRSWMELAPRAAFYNLYGPTETNVCLFHRAPRPWPAGDASIPIGRPLPETKVLVCREKGGATAPGERGELWVKGPTVMERYAGGSTGPRKKGFYGTGDIVSLGEDGSYRFWGRRDDQVKVRGYRVDLKEVEAALAALPETAQAAVTTADEGGRLVLVAHVTAKPGRRPSEKRLLKALARRLPSYMIPSKVVLRDRLPRLPTGKVDRRSLAGSAAAGVSTAQVRSLLEGKILRGRSLRDDESFWGSGALDSLDLLQFVHHLEAAFSLRIPETDVTPEVFSSIESVSRYLGKKAR